MNELPWLVFGGGGHEREYVLNIPEYDHNNYIPRSIECALQERLPGWDVCNRGSRIEITHKEPYGIRIDTEVYPAVFDVIGVFNVSLPILLVLDDEGNGELVRCAIVRETDDCWFVKPLCEREFNEKEWLSTNTAFHMALWRVAKNDLSAQVADRDAFHTGNLHRLVVEKAMGILLGR